jgi:hypothetical protein
VLKEGGAEESVGVIYSVSMIPLYLLANFPSYSLRRSEGQVRTEARTEDAQLRPTAVAISLNVFFYIFVILPYIMDAFMFTDICCIL